jgi:creatinine amidohydrolase/Fe(II)-dependent formamide hydrolase-like protein
MLHLSPELVDTPAAPSGEKIVNACPYPSSQAFVSTWTRQKSRSGVYGEPTAASAEFGAVLFDVIVEKTAEFFAYYHALDQPGCTPA